MLGLLAIASLGVVLYDAATRRASSAPCETGARTWQQDKRAAELKAMRRARKDARARVDADDVTPAERDALKRLVRDSERLGRARELAGQRRRSNAVNCCDAPSDDWRESRDWYDRWRPDSGGLSFRDAKEAALAESIAFAERGDYSKPASRRAVLGKMHAAKRLAWEQCRAGCAGEDWRFYEGPEGRTAVSWGGQGETLYLNPLALDWWALERYHDRRGFGELDRFPSYNEAMNAAQARLLDDEATTAVAQDDEIPF